LVGRQCFNVVKSLSCLKRVHKLTSNNYIIKALIPEMGVLVSDLPSEEQRKHTGVCNNCGKPLELYSLDLKTGRRVLQCVWCGQWHFQRYEKKSGKWKLMKTTIHQTRRLLRECLGLLKMSSAFDPPLDVKHALIDVIPAIFDSGFKQIDILVKPKAIVVDAKVTITREESIDSSSHPETPEYPSAYDEYHAHFSLGKTRTRIEIPVSSINEKRMAKLLGVNRHYHNFPGVFVEQNGTEEYIPIVPVSSLGKLSTPVLVESIKKAPRRILFEDELGEAGLIRLLYEASPPVILHQAFTLNKLFEALWILKSILLKLEYLESYMLLHGNLKDFVKKTYLLLLRRFCKNIKKDYLLKFRPDMHSGDILVELCKLMDFINWGKYYISKSESIALRLNKALSEYRQR